MNNEKEQALQQENLENIESFDQSSSLAETPQEFNVLILRNKVLFPHVQMPITLRRLASQSLAEESIQHNQQIVVVCQKDEKTVNPGANDIHSIGVLARISHIMPEQGGRKVVILQGLERVRIQQVTAENPYMKALIKRIPEESALRNDSSLQNIITNLQNTAIAIADNLDNGIEQIPGSRNDEYSFDTTINMYCCRFKAATSQIQELLEVNNIKLRALFLYNDMMKVSHERLVKKDVLEKTEQLLAKGQRDYFLQQELRAIQNELGDDTAQDIETLKSRGFDKNWGKVQYEHFMKEVKKLERTDIHSPEYSILRNYLELVLSLPWQDVSKDKKSLPYAERVLNKDHFGMEEVKERILEYLASKRKDGMILCLWGPPGVGKTSLGKSIATSLGRKYARISLGGMHDESEIRGHRKTYIGAMPGRIIENLKKVGTSNPVFVLDEIDKMCSSYQGDPTSALLEVLDPEQNNTFHDNYLDMDYDLSQVLFIATANSLQSIPRPLLDRMELIEMNGYLVEEKEQIAKRHLIPKELKKEDLTQKDLRFSAKALRCIIDEYTRESGVRGLEREIASCVRKIVKRKAMNQAYHPLLQPDDIHQLLGKPRYSRDRYEGNDYPGVVTGLAWTQVGGEILYIETSMASSKTPSLTLTGNLGDVMKESANIALSYIRSHATDFGIQPDFFEDKMIHVHVPEGAVPKDGPSAGITMTTAMISCFTGRKVRAQLAMTGEMTLRGKVLPVGGIKEKILAAKRAGITTIVLCKENEKDIAEIPEMYTQGVSFHYVSDIHEVIEFALL